MSPALLGSRDLVLCAGTLPQVPFQKRVAAAAEPGGEPLPSLHSARYAPLPEPTLRVGMRSLANLALSLLDPASD